MTNRLGLLSLEDRARAGSGDSIVQSYMALKRAQEVITLLLLITQNLESIQ